MFCDGASRWSGRRCYSKQPPTTPVSRTAAQHTQSSTLVDQSSLPGVTTRHTVLDKLRLGCYVVRSPGGLKDLFSNAVHPAEAVGNELRVLLAARQAIRGVREISVPALGESQVVGAVEAVPLQAAINIRGGVRKFRVGNHYPEDRYQVDVSSHKVSGKWKTGGVKKH